MSAVGVIATWHHRTKRREPFVPSSKYRLLDSELLTLGALRRGFSISVLQSSTFCPSAVSCRIGCILSTVNWLDWPRPVDCQTYRSFTNTHMCLHHGRKLCFFLLVQHSTKSLDWFTWNSSSERNVSPLYCLIYLSEETDKKARFETWHFKQSQSKTKEPKKYESIWWIYMRCKLQL